LTQNNLRLFLNLVVGLQVS